VRLDVLALTDGGLAGALELSDREASVHSSALACVAADCRLRPVRL